MTKVTLNNVGSLIDATTAATTINNNFNTIETAFDNTLSRDGTSPNQMLSNIDINSNKIINLPNATANGEAVNYQQFISLITPVEGFVVNTSPIFGGTPGGILFDNNGVVSCTDLLGSANLRTSGTFSILPVSGTTTRGLNILQTLPSTGSIAGMVYSNLIKGSLNTTLTGTNPNPNDPLSASWALLQVSASVGSNYTGLISSGLSVGMVTNGPTTTTSDLVGLNAGVSSNYSSLSRLYGGTFAATTGTTGTTPFLISCEFGNEQDNPITSQVPYRAGINIDNYGLYQAGTVDTAISIQGGRDGGQWQHVLSLVTVGGTVGAGKAIATTGDFLYAETAQTVGSIINVPLLDITNYVFNTKHTTLTGAGLLSLGDLTNNGGVVINGSAGSNIAYTFQNGASPTYQIGAVTANLYMTAVGFGTPALTVTSSNNLLSAPSGLSVANGFTATGTVTLGGFTFSHAGNTSLPAIVQGDLWYGSAASTISALTKSVSSNQYLKNSGTTNNPAWASIVASDITSGAALTKTDDTNVTLTLGGTPTSALLVATSLTLGWTGTLALSRLAQGTDGQLIVGQTSSSPLYKSITGDWTINAAGASLLATVNTNVGTFGSATQATQLTVNGKGLITAASNVTVTPAVGSITGLGTGVATALGVNVGSAGAFVTFNGALGSPSSVGTLPAHTLGGTISGGGSQINNVIIGTTTPLAGFFTTISATGASITLSNAAPVLFISKTASGQDTALLGQTGGLSRWLINLGNATAESGANAGSNFAINRYSDAGSFIDTTFTIVRSTGAATFTGSLTAASLNTSTAPTAVSGAGPILVGSGSTMNSRMKVNLNGTDYWIPCSTTAF